MKANVREVQGVSIVDLKGKITIGSGDVQLREVINGLVEKGKRNILVNMKEVTTIDSSGIGELVGCDTSVTNTRGESNLRGLPPKISDAPRGTKISTECDVYESEPEDLATHAA